MTTRTCESCGDVVSTGYYCELESPAEDGPTSIAFRLCDWCAERVSEHPVLQDAIRRAGEDVVEPEPEIMTDGGQEPGSPSTRLREAIKQVRVAREDLQRNPLGPRPDQDSSLAKAEYLLRGVADELEEDDGPDELDPHLVTDGAGDYPCDRCGTRHPDRGAALECCSSDLAENEQPVVTDGGQTVAGDVDDQKGSVWLDCPACESRGTILAEGDLRCVACGETFDEEEVS